MSPPLRSPVANMQGSGKRHTSRGLGKTKPSKDTDPVVLPPVVREPPGETPFPRFEGRNPLRLMIGMSVVPPDCVHLKARSPPSSGDKSTLPTMERPLSE